MDGESIAIAIMVMLFLTVLFSLVAGIYDIAYLAPVAAEKANEHCKAIGFDQHKSFSRVGMFSKDPVAIKCEYAERYTDLGIRVN